MQQCLYTYHFLFVFVKLYLVFVFVELYFVMLESCTTMPVHVFRILFV